MGPGAKLRTAAALARRGGVCAVGAAVLRKLRGNRQPMRYIRWNGLSRRELRRQRAAAFQSAPLISVAVPVYRTPPEFLSALIKSLRRQTYPRWELCLADGGGEGHTVDLTCGELLRGDRRIRHAVLPQNYGISGNTNRALEMAKGDIIAFVDHDDLLSCDALYEIARAAEDTGTDCFYSDMDRISADGTRRFDPYYKGAFGPDTLRASNYICHLFALRRELAERVGPLDPAFDGSQDYDYILRATERSRGVRHIPRILYHWRVHSQSVAAGSDAKPYALDAAERALTAHTQRLTGDGEAEKGLTEGSYHIRFDAPPDLPVLALVREREAGGAEEMIEQIRPQLRPGDRALPIRGGEDTLRALAGHPGFDLVLLLDSRLRRIAPGSLDELRALFHYPAAGAAAGILRGPGGHTLHCGYALSADPPSLLPLFQGYPPEATGYAARAKSVNNISALSACCLIVRRSVIESLPAALLDLSPAHLGALLCLEAGRQGLFSTYTPYAAAEAPPEFQDLDPRETPAFRAAAGECLERGDPYLNPNLKWVDGDIALR